MDNYNGPGYYHHYKGGEYRVLGLALREDSITKDPRARDGAFGVGERFVIYQPMTHGSILETANYGDCDFWARELGNFQERVNTEGGSVPRFESGQLTGLRIPVTDGMLKRFKAVLRALGTGGGITPDETVRAAIDAAINGRDI